MMVVNREWFGKKDVYYDNISGEWLDAELVRAARKEEMAPVEARGICAASSRVVVPLVSLVRALRCFLCVLQRPSATLDRKLSTQYQLPRTVHMLARS